MSGIICRELYLQLHRLLDRSDTSKSSYFGVFRYPYFTLPVTKYDIESNNQHSCIVVELENLSSVAPKLKI